MFRDMLKRSLNLLKMHKKEDTTPDKIIVVSIVLTHVSLMIAGIAFVYQVS